MAGSDRTPAAALEALLSEIERDPHRFDFFHLLRRIEGARPDLPRFGTARSPREEAVRLSQPPSLSFAPSTVTNAGRNPRSGRPTVGVAFMGLLGPQGPLPLHVTEHIWNRIQHHGDDAHARFLDIFNHRMLLLFYRAWAETRAIVGRDRPEFDRFAERVRALFGHAGEAFVNRDAMPDDAKLYFSGHLAAVAKRPVALAAMLRDILRVPLRVVDYAARWIELPANGRWRLGRRTGFSTLGLDVIVGHRVFDVQSGARIELGPLQLAEYRSFLPPGGGAGIVLAVIRNHMGDELEWDINLQLEAEQVPDLRLDGVGQLGWTTWLGERRSPRPAVDLTLRLNRC